MTPTPRTPETAEQPEQPERREPVYEPPALVEVGSFAEVTRGNDGPIPGDFPAFRRGFWLI